VPLLRASQIPTRQRGVGLAEASPHTRGIRLGFAAVGVFLCVAALWLMGAELLRAKAGGAGHVGLFRGYVWLDDGLALWAELLAKPTGSAPDAEKLAAARSALMRAARFAPHDSRAWLVLAAVEARSGAAADTVAAALKMSYYTGSNDAALIPLRVALAAQANLAGDAELRSLLENEIRTIAQHASVRPSMAQAYRQASADGRRVLREIVTPIDAKLSSDMQAGTP
jgi:cytochrome c-type biogenesis protein CcmH/NrfG